jgi:hypothetical protein
MKLLPRKITKMLCAFCLLFAEDLIDDDACGAIKVSYDSAKVVGKNFSASLKRLAKEKTDEI